jgi:capsular polysaccharide transport system ATP-binding protein
MIVLRSISRAYGHGASRNQVLEGVDAEFESGRHYVILGLRGSGKSTLLRIMSGLQSASSGSISREGTVSLPVGTASILAALKSGRQLAVLLAELYGADVEDVSRYALAFSELGEAFDYPVGALSPRQRARLNYALGYAIPCDTYLFDELTGFGNDEFAKRCNEAFLRRQRSAGTIIATRNLRTAADRGDHGGILHDRKLYLFAKLSEALEVFKELELQATSDGVSYAEALVKRGDTAGARKYLKTYLSQHRGDFRAYELLANLSLKHGLANDARTAARGMLHYTPHSAEACIILATIAEQSGRLAEAVEQLEKAVALEPDNRKAAVTLAKVLEKAKRHGEAATAWSRLGTSGEDSRYLRLAIRNDMIAKNWEGVLDSTNVALSNRPNEHELMSFKLRALLGLRRWDDAKLCLVRLAEHDAKRAVDEVYRLTKTTDWKMIPEFLQALPKPALSGHRTSPTMRHMRAFLELKATSARRQGDLGVLDAVSDALHSLESAQS